MKNVRSTVLPYKTAVVGSRVRIGGSEYEVVERPSMVMPRGACTGCAFRLKSCPAGWGCSRFDRSDGRFIWFIESKGQGYED